MAAAKSITYLRPVRMTVDPYVNDETTLRVTLPDWSQDAAVALSIFPAAALLDHEVLSIEHNDIEHVGNSAVTPSDAGVPLGHVASFIGPKLAETTSPIVQGSPLKFWPGYQRDDASPCPRNVALLPIKGTREVSIRVRRLYGATVISRATLHTVFIEDREYHARLCDGRRSLNNQPYWLVSPLEYAAAATVYRTEVEARWRKLDGFGLRIMQTFVAGYSKHPDTSVLAWSPRYADAALMRMTGYSGERLLPAYADEMQPIANVGPFFMQDYDCIRDPGLLIPDRSGLRIWREGLLTTELKDVRLTFYGTLVNE